jgi:signal transduction histidine kinase
MCLADALRRRPPVGYRHHRLDATRRAPAPDTEAHVSDFADLVATAIANAATRAELTALGHWLPESVEVAAFYVVAETLTNAAKHARAPEVNVSVETEDGNLRL